MKHSSILKRFSLLLLAMVLCLTCFGCSNDTDSGTDVDPSGIPALSAIYEEIQSAVTLPELLELDRSEILSYLGIPSDAYAEAVALIPTEAILGDMLLLFHAASVDTIDTIQEKLNAFREQKLNEMNNYLPDEYAKISASSVTVRGAYLWLVVSSESAAITDIIDRNIQ